MINAVNAIIECFVTGLFTAGLLVLCTNLGWFPVMIVQAMTQEQYDEATKQEEIDDE
tara:strand:+ start:1132 stop:1302 length:171 start_codon:yes stop_codon:yes gene_type:complete